MPATVSQTSRLPPSPTPSSIVRQTPPPSSFLDLCLLRAPLPSPIPFQSSPFQYLLYTTSRSYCGYLLKDARSSPHETRLWKDVLSTMDGHAFGYSPAMSATLPPALPPHFARVEDGRSRRALAAFGYLLGGPRVWRVGVELAFERAGRQLDAAGLCDDAKSDNRERAFELADARPTFPLPPSSCLVQKAP